MNILVAIDKDELSNKLVEKAIKIAKDSKGKIYILSVVEQKMLNLSNVISYEEKKKEVKEILLKYKELVESHNINCKALLRNNLPHQNIINCAKENDIDLIIMGKKSSKKIQHFLFESTVSNVVLKFDGNILIISESKNNDVGPNQPQEQLIKNVQINQNTI